MASKTLVLLEDDVDGGEATETLRFAFEGKWYVIDLNDKNAAKFRKAVAPYVASARREGASQIRAWVKQNGYAVSERGRIAREIQEAYDA